MLAGMVGYSATPQARKLGLKSGQRVDIVAAPRGWSLDDPPELDRVAHGSVDVLIAFVRSPDDLDAAAWGERIFPDGSVWVLWPRKAAGHVSDVTDNGIRDAVLPLGLVDVKVAAVDDDWSGLKVVWRAERRSRSEK
jgi:hypothetical protein